MGKHLDYWKLEQLVRQNNTVLMEKLLEDTKCVQFDKYHIVLRIACEELARYTSPGVIRILVSHIGDDEDFTTIKTWKCGNYSLLHFFALEENLEMLELICERCPCVNGPTYDNKTCLHLLAEREQYKTNEDNVLSCARLLITKGLDVNLRDNKCYTAIDWALQNKHVGLIRLILEQGIVDIDTYFESTEERAYLSNYSKFTARQQIEELGISTQDIPLCTINNTLYEYLQSNQQNEFVKLAGTLDVIHCYNVFMESACHKWVTGVVKYLLRRGPDYPMYRGFVLDPFKYICKINNFELFEDMLTHISNHNVFQVLKSIFHIIEQNPTEKEKVIYFYRISIEKLSKTFDVNHIIREHKTLQQAVDLQLDEVVVDLLSRGASLANKTDAGKCTIHSIRSDMLMERFNSCISKDEFYPEFAMQFCCSNLVSVDPSGEENVAPEIEVIVNMAKSARLKPLLKHPLVTCFVDKKWEQISWIYYMNFALSGALFLLTFAYIFLDYLHGDVQDTNLALKVLVVVMNFASFFVEVLQFIISPWAYVVDFENYVDVFINLLIFTITLANIPSINVRIQICSPLIILIALAIMFLLAEFPTFSRNSAMFRTVTREYFKFLAFFSILILGFALSFYLLFGYNRDKEDNPFSNPALTIFTTLVMLTGELDAGSIDFEETSLMSYIIFVLFLFSLLIILLNLLNGLAISDVQKIKDDAEMLAMKVRIEYIAYIESAIYWELPSSNNGVCNLIFNKYVRALHRNVGQFMQRNSAVFIRNYSKKLIVATRCNLGCDYFRIVNWLMSPFAGTRFHLDLHVCELCEFRRVYKKNITFIDEKRMAEVEQILKGRKRKGILKKIATDVCSKKEVEVKELCVEMQKSIGDLQGRLKELENKIK